MALAIPLLFALLAQAEPAPPESTSPVPTAPVPAAPPQAAVPGALSAPEPPQMRVGLSGGMAYQATGDVGPRWGYGIGVFMGRTWLTLGPAQLGLRGQFDFERFSTAGTARTMDGKSTYQAERTLSFFQFSALPTLSIAVGRVRPWVGAGAGFAMGYLSTAEDAYLPGEFSATKPVLMGLTGVDVPLRGEALLGLQLAYERVLGAPEFRLDSGAGLHPFGSRVSARLALSYEF